MKLASLFDGSGGWPLAASMCGIKPAWSSEIEKFPCQVTAKNFLSMKNYGDVKKIHGYKAEPVDLICAGSPCQDLSIAGKRAGLSGNRSSLFMDSIRIVKEMREKTNGTYPKYFVWENVYGAFSSNGGEDFRTVLDTIAKVKEPTASVPRPKKWEHSGLVMGNGWSIGWRGLDAEYWGVPQRRKRIFLVADFTGGCAGKILFERKGLSGYFEEINEKGKATSHDVEDSAGKSSTGVDTVCCIQGNSIGRKDENGCGGRGWREGHSYTLNTIDRPAVVAFKKQAHPKSKDDPQMWEETKVNDTINTFDNGETRTPTIILENHAADSRISISKNNICPTLSASMGTGGNNAPLLMRERCGKPGGGKGPLIQVNMSGTLGCNNDQKLFEPKCIGNGQLAQLKVSKVCGTLNCMHDQIAIMETNVDSEEQLASGLEHTGTIMSQCYKGFTGDQEAFSGDYSVINNNKKTIRRLTPLECCRLQGFPDNWCDGIPHSDTAEYKMWGNGMALPCALYVMEGIKDAILDNDGKETE